MVVSWLIYRWYMCALFSYGFGTWFVGRVGATGVLYSQVEYSVWPIGGGLQLWMADAYRMFRSETLWFVGTLRGFCSPSYSRVTARGQRGRCLWRLSVRSSLVGWPPSSSRGLRGFPPHWVEDVCWFPRRYLSLEPRRGQTLGHHGQWWSLFKGLSSMLSVRQIIFFSPSKSG